MVQTLLHTGKKPRPSGRCYSVRSMSTEPETAFEPIVDITAIRSAQKLIKPYVRRTFLERSEALSADLGTNVFVKYELFQKTGSFKVRGAFNKLLNMSEEDRSRGVVAVSGGNHAQAVAFAASRLGVDAIIVMPENTPEIYLKATRGYGATVETHPNITAAFEKMEEYSRAGRVVMHPFDDPLIIAGQGTVGLEILEDLPEVTDVFASIGGGGLAGGTAVAIKDYDPTIRVWGVETDGANAMALALKAGEPVTLPAITSIAKTLGAPFVTESTLRLASFWLESVTVVEDAEAVECMQFILERLKVITEPAAACTVAAARRLKSKFDASSNVVLIFCGGNTSVGDLCGYVSDMP